MQDAALLLQNDLTHVVLRHVTIAPTHGTEDEGNALLQQIVRIKPVLGRKSNGIQQPLIRFKGQDTVKTHDIHPVVGKRT